jgi:hypothetical protein
MVWEHRYVQACPGETWLAARLAAPGTSWAYAEAAVVALDLDGAARQHLILAGGDEPVEYCRVLGRLPSGGHIVRLWIDRSLSAPSATLVELHAIRTGTVPGNHEAAAAWRHAPILHYRPGKERPESVTTDTPLLLFYRPVSVCDGPGRGRASAPAAAAHARRGIEYHAVFSHEDAGTDLTGLLAKWGHTTDIEWVYRVLWDEAGVTVREEFQGSGHRTMPFRGARALGGHPVLQVSGRHGMVTDRVRCPFRAALAPVWRQPEDEPREAVMHAFPWTWRVSAQEVVRQVALEPIPMPATPAPADPRAYVFLHWKREPSGRIPLEAAVQIGDAWYTSAWGRADLAFAGDDAEATAIKIPAASGASPTAVAVRALAAPAGPAGVRLVRAFVLDETYRPGPALAASGAAQLRLAGAWVPVWPPGASAVP